MSPRDTQRHTTPAHANSKLPELKQVRQRLLDMIVKNEVQRRMRLAT
jgi:hypothetical protein